MTDSDHIIINLRTPKSLIERIEYFRAWKQEDAGVSVSRTAAILCLIAGALAAHDEQEKQLDGDL
jgi:hypothetical protein